MKKTAIILALIIITVAFSACAKKDERVQKYVDKNQSIEEICSNVYVSCTLTERDSSVVLTLTATDLDNATQESKAFFDEMMSEIEPERLFDKMKKEESAIKSLIIEFCETDGDVVASYEYK